MRQLLRDMEDSQFTFWLMIQLMMVGGGFITYQFSLREYFWAGWVFGLPVGVALVPMITAWNDLCVTRRQKRRFR